MIVRDHCDGATRSSATYSDCELYRYALTRTWAEGPRLLFVLLNPSTATEARNDPTVGRCERRARALGYGAFRVTNLFALRETDPGAMRLHPAPTGPDNAAALAEGADWADVVLCGWGNHGAHLGQGPATEAMLRRTGRPLHVLGLTRAGHPRHPLYIANSAQPRLWPIADALGNVPA